MATFATFLSLLFIAFVFTISNIFLLTFSFGEVKVNGDFSVDLIHRDSIKSPFYDTSITSYKCVSNAIQCSISRVNHLAISSPSSTETSLIFGDYVLNISIGTPAVTYIGVVATGSDLIWIQCEPCPECRTQKEPLFSPKNSLTYKEVPCHSTSCKSFKGISCSTHNGSCQYTATYMDKSYTNGVLATETLTLQSTTAKPISLPKIIFGCGHNNSVEIMKHGESGIVGFGWGKFSLISQMKYLIHGKFSYCFPPISSQLAKPTKMNFGDIGVVSGPGVVSVPLYTGFVDYESNYYVTLEAISIGDKKLEVESPILGGNMIIDSGTVLSCFDTYLHMKIEREVQKAINAEPVEDPLKFLHVCYRTQDNITIPPITVHFRGADVKLNAENTFVKTSEDVMCLAFAAEDRISIFGNLAQVNFKVGYNLKENIISFKRTDCTKE